MNRAAIYWRGDQVLTSEELSPGEQVEVGETIRHDGMTFSIKRTMYERTRGDYQYLTVKVQRVA